MFASEEAQREIWSPQTEFMARTVELLNEILKALNTGIPVKLAKHLSKPSKPYQIERPGWVKPKTEERTMRPRDFFALMRRQQNK